jgi:hypothetical protein
MHPLLEAYKKHTLYEYHRTKYFNHHSLFVNALTSPHEIMEIHWQGLAYAMRSIGLPDYYETIRAVFRVGWEKGDPTGELKALFQEVVNGPLNKELDEYM